jgi:hypothetical protein
MLMCSRLGIAELCCLALCLWNLLLSGDAFALTLGREETINAGIGNGGRPAVRAPYRQWCASAFHVCCSCAG